MKIRSIAIVGLLPVLFQTAQTALAQNDVPSETWQCGAPTYPRCFEDRSEQSCPIVLTSNLASETGTVTFAGVLSETAYSVEGLRRLWVWSDLESNFGITIPADAEQAQYAVFSASTEELIDNMFLACSLESGDASSTSSQGLSENTSNAVYLPLVAISPQYPARAARRGIEGWNLVSYTVDKLGNVVEDSIVVLDAEPPEIFDQSSIRAAARFKYQPKSENGQAVEVSGVQYLFRYDLPD